MAVRFVYDGAMNGNVFRAHVEQVLVPTLAGGGVVIKDNLPAHKAAGVRDAIQAAGASLIKADASKQRSAEGSDTVDWKPVGETRRSVQEYLDALRGMECSQQNEGEIRVKVWSAGAVVMSSERPRLFHISHQLSRRHEQCRHR